jgi:hypothetical protein
VLKEADFKPLAPQRCRCKDRHGLLIFSSEDTIQLGTEVGCLTQVTAREGTVRAPSSSKTGKLHYDLYGILVTLKPT